MEDEDVATSTWTYWNTSSTSTNTMYNSTDGSWVSWNTTSASTTSTDNSWYYWVNDSTTDATVRTHDEAWTTWNEGTITIIEGDYSTPYVDRRRTRLRAKRTRLRAEKEARKQRARRAMRELELQKAEEIAQELLLDLIGPEQMEVYKRTGRVFVKGRKFDWLLQTEGSRCRLKRITRDKVHDLCIHIGNDEIPKTDQVIGYLLNAKFNEEHLDKTANLVRVNEKKDFEDRIKEAANA